MATDVNIQSFVNYSELLTIYGVSYIPNGYYWQVGEINNTQGWIIHLSVVESELDALLQMVVPKFIELQTPFKIVRDKFAASRLLEGTFGYNNLGKMVCVYPEDDQQAVELANKMIAWTKGFRGPDIPTDRLLGSIVYTRYGSFNPVLRTDVNGQWVKYIYNAAGELIQDPYHIPFCVPAGISWPFSSIATPLPQRKSKLLNYKYYPLTVIKPDTKGIVMRGLYFKKLWQIRTCLLKQGKKNMLLDPYGRGMSERLQWQYELYQSLGKDIPMPEVFDHFKDENGDDWLAMEFIKGQPLTKWIADKMDGKCWRDLGVEIRRQLLDQLLTIIAAIQRMHKKGYVHRDITSDNFLVDKHDHIHLIDLELSWSTETKYPDPPFQGGTPGYASPEQFAEQAPTEKEDIFGIGGLMVMFLTGLYPFMFNSAEADKFHTSLFFFTEDRQLAECIVACQQLDASKRPDIAALKHTVEKCRHLQAPQNSQPTPIPEPDQADLENVIRAGLSGLGSQSLLGPRGQWFSLPYIREERVGNEQLEKKLYSGWHTGMAGPVWLVSLAAQLGFPIEECLKGYTQSFDYLRQQLQNEQAGNPGLYWGNAGVGLAISAGLDSGIVIPNTKIVESLQHCFSNTVAGLDLATGVAGQGIAMLRCAHHMDPQVVQGKLDAFIEKILAAQQKDGSWALYEGDGSKREIILGLDHGVAGVCLFLITYLEKYPNDAVINSVQRALSWLLKFGVYKKDGSFVWPVTTSNKTKDALGSSLGMPGIILVFIKAYEVLNDNTYKKAAEDALQSTPVHPVQMDLSLQNGLTGLGELYLEAAKVLKEDRWQDRAIWISQLLLHTYQQRDSNEITWITNMNGTITADLHTGNSGILHFLMRCHAPETIFHPLLQNQILQKQ